MQRMIANKRMRYGTRRLKAGDMFDADTRDSRVLAAVGRARMVDNPKVNYLKVPPHDSITMARAEYERVFGKRPHMGWDESELRRRIATGPLNSRQSADLLTRG